MTSESRDVYFDRAEPCVFLDQDKCSIYAVRPVDCRAFYAVTPAEDCCPPTHDRPIGSLAMYEPRIRCMAVGRQVHAMLGLKETGMRVLLGSLPGVVLLALEVLQDDVGDWREYVRRQKWMTAEELMQLGKAASDHVPILQQLKTRSGLLRLSEED